jgi:hypothetical protein
MRIRQSEPDGAQKKLYFVITNVWYYDSFSLAQLLTRAVFRNVVVRRSLLSGRGWHYRFEGKTMKVMLVNFTTSYHRAVAESLAKKGVVITSVFYLKGYRDPLSVERKDIPQTRFENNPLFANTRLVDIRDFQYADRVTGYITDEAVELSARLLEEFRECENAFMRAADRFSFYALKPMVLRRIYYGMLAGLLRIFDEDDPDLVFFSDFPHVAYDTVLFYIAKHLNVKTAMLRNCHINDTSILFFDYRSAEKVPADFLRKLSSEDLRKRVSEEFPGLDLGKSKHLQLSHDRLRAINKFKYKSGSVLGFLKRVKRMARTGMFLKDSRLQYSRVLLYNSKASMKDYATAVRVYNKKIKALKRLLGNRAAVPVDLDAPFVFFALHKQPELSTSAMAGVFEDQYLAVKILSMATPPDWKVVVKEHPAQLVYRLVERMNYRDAEYYELIAKIPKVIMLPAEASYGDLHTHSKVNVTMAGSSGWESLMMGKAPVVFGKPWYNACRSCLSVGSVEECRRAIARSLELTKEEVYDDVHRYLLHMKDRMYHFSANPTRMHLFDMPTLEQIESYSRLIAGLLEETPKR